MCYVNEKIRNPNMKKHLIALTMAFLSAGAMIASAATDAERLTDVLSSSVEKGIAVGKVKVEKVTTNSKTRTVTVKCNESTSYLPFTMERVTALKKEMLAALGPSYKNYKIVVTANGFKIEDLAIDADRKLSLIHI